MAVSSSSNNINETASIRARTTAGVLLEVLDLVACATKLAGGGGDDGSLHIEAGVVEGGEEDSSLRGAAGTEGDLLEGFGEGGAKVFGHLGGGLFAMAGGNAGDKLTERVRGGRGS